MWRLIGVINDAHNKGSWLMKYVYILYLLIIGRLLFFRRHRGTPFPGVIEPPFAAGSPRRVVDREQGSVCHAQGLLI